jgi:tRNA A37 threonylcarbamoyladenosine biosynthesis protein TsaE
VNHEIESGQAMQQLGQKIGCVLAGGEVIELIGDVGAGMTKKGM